MSTPYQFATPRIPHVPHPTPASIAASSYSLPQPKQSRPPIHNPYDKFSQNDFDAWIGGITGALRKALGQEEEVHPPQPQEHSQDAFQHSRVVPEASEDESDVGPEDSFAEFKNRRAQKGKARDPREGPGLNGVGNMDKPIEILSDDDEEQEQEERSGPEEEDIDDEETSQGEEVAAPPYRYGPASVQRSHAHVRKSARRDEELEDDEEEYEEDIRESRSGSPEQIVVLDSDEEAPAVTSRLQGHSDEERSEEEYSEDEEGTGTTQLLGPSSRAAAHFQHVEGDEEEFSDADSDKYTGPVVTIDEGEGDEIDEIEDDEVQPLEDDTSFPPKSRTSRRPVDIPDPWYGPQTYAEDYYAGGTVRAPISAHQLGANDYDDFLTPDVRTPLELQEEEEGGEYEEYEEEQDNLDEAEDESEEQETTLSKVVQQEAFSVDDNEAEEEHLEESNARGTRPTRILIEGDEDDRLPGSSPIPSSPIEEQYGSSASHATPTQHPIEMLQNLEGLYDEMDMHMGPLLDTGPVQNVLSDLVDWNFPPAFPAGIPTSASGHLATPSEFLSVHAESASGTFISTQDDFFSFSVQGPTPQPTNADLSDEEEEEEGDEAFGRGFPLGTSDLDIPDAEEDEEGEEGGNEDAPGSDEFMEVVMPAEVEEADTEDEDESERRKGKAVLEEEVEEIIMPEGAGEPWVKKTEEGVEKVETTVEIVKEVVKEKEVEKESIMEEAIQQKIVEEAVQQKIIEDAQEQTMIEETPEAIAPEVDVAAATIPEAVVAIHEEVEQVEGIELPSTALESPRSSPSPEVELPTEVTDVNETVTAEVEEEVKEIAAAPESPQGSPAVEVEQPAEVINNDEEEVHLPSEPQAEEQEEAMEDVEDENEEPAQQPESPQAGPSLQPPTQPASQSQLQLPVQPAPALHPVQQHHYQQYEYEQLPTPPSERMSSADLPSEHEEGLHKVHPSVEIEKVPDEDTTPSGTAQEEEAEFSARSMDIELEQEKTELEKAEPEGYTVIEATSDGGYDDEYTDEDAHGDLDSELDVEEMDNDVEPHEWHGYTVEEPLTEGRLTEEPTTRATSLGVVSVDTEGVTREHSVAHEPLSSMAEVSEPSTDADADFQETVTEPATSGSSIVIQVEEPTPEEDDAQVDEPPSKTPGPSKNSTKSLGSEIPMPVSANPSIPDPTETTEAPSRARPPRLVSLPGTPTFMLSPVGTPGSGVPTPVSIAVPQSVLNALKQHAHIQRGEGQGGLFTPGEPSDAITQEILQEVVHDDELNSEENSLEEVVEEVVDDEVQHDETKEATEVPHEAIPPSGHSTDGSSKMLSTDASQVAATAFALAESLPKPPSLPHRTPSSSLYPSKVTMHKSTDPILHSDPYPYSLSTPGSGFFDTSKEEESDEGTEQDNSMSSASTLDRDRDEDEDKLPDNTLEDADLDDLEFQYPTASDDDIGTVPSAIEPPAGPHFSSNIADVEDKDADGELDPEFIDEDIVTQTPPSQPVIDVMQEEDPFKLMGTDSTVAPGPVEEGSSSEANAEEEVVKGLTEEAPTLEKPKSAPLDVEHIAKTAESQPSELKEVPQHGILSGSDSEGCTKELGRASPRPVEEMERKTKVDSSDVEGERTSSHSSKRKRAKSPDATAFRLTRSASSKKPPKARAPAREKPKRAAKVVGDTIHVKPRVKGTEESISREGSEKPSEISLDNSSSGASAVGKILKPGSRASSVASTVMSDRSLIVQPSPTVQKPGMNINRPAPPPPPPLFHAHGQTRKQQHHMPPMPIQQQIHRQVTRVPSFTRTSESRMPARNSPSPSTSTHPTPSHRPTPSSSSPVTRSHCRYHKISLPKEEGGPRVCFLVPGCSLTDRGLMEEEEIEDHGDATHEDSLRMVTDIESLDFDAYLIGILRQLVGVDILREQEVFYLPSPGEEVTRKPIRHRTASASMVRAPDSSITMTSPSLSFTSVRSPISPKAPTSVAGSTGTSFSALRRVWGSNKDSDRESLSRVTDTESELTDAEDELPKVKRLRPSPPDDNTASSSMGPPPTQTQSANKLKNRRSSKRLGVDASAYKPQSDDEASSTTDDGTHSSQARRKGAKRGIKRTRATESVTAEDAENRKQKKQKTRVSGMAERG